MGIVVILFQMNFHFSIGSVPFYSYPIACVPCCCNVLPL